MPKGEFKYKGSRTRSMMMYGFLIDGPFLHVAYSMILPVIAPGNSNIAILKKVIACNTVFTLYSAVTYYFFMPLFGGGTIEDSVSELKLNLWETLVMNWTTWPLIDFVNFKYVPIKLQTLYVNIMNIWWNCYLSYMSFVKQHPSKGQTPPADDKEQHPK